jgi:hypothetical protein
MLGRPHLRRRARRIRPGAQVAEPDLHFIVPTCGDLRVEVVQARLQVRHRRRRRHLRPQRRRPAAQLRVLRRQRRHLGVRQPAGDPVQLRRCCLGG